MGKRFILIVMIILFAITMGILIWVDYSNEQKSIRKWEENLAKKFQSNPSSAQVIGDMRQ